MPRHARTQTGTRVIICDAGRPAPVMVLSGRRAAGQADPLPPEKQILGRGCPDAQVMNPSSRRSPPHFLITERRYSALRSLPAGRPQARGRRAGGSVGRDLLLPGRASPAAHIPALRLAWRRIPVSRAGAAGPQLVGQPAPWAPHPLLSSPVGAPLSPAAPARKSVWRGRGPVSRGSSCGREAVT